MLTTLTIKKTIDQRAKTQSTLWEVCDSMKAMRLTWKRTEFAFRAHESRGISTKSLRTIAKQNPFLQPHYQQKFHDLAASQATGGWQQVWKFQNFAEAIARYH